MKKSLVLKAVFATSLAISLPGLVEPISIQANAATQKQTSTQKTKKNMTLATKKGEAVSKVAKELNKEIDKGDIKRVKTTQSKLKKSIKSYKTYLKKISLPQKNKNTLTKKYVTPNQKVVDGIQKEIDLANTIDQAIKGLVELSYNDTQAKIDELTYDVSTINETRLQNGQQEVNDNLLNAFNAKIEILKKQAISNEEMEVEKLKIKYKDLEDASAVLSKAMNGANLKVIQEEYNKFINIGLNYQSLIDNNEKISNETRRVLKKQYIEPAGILQAQIIKEKDLYTSYYNAISYLKNYQYIQAQNILNNIKQVIEEGKIHRLEKKVPNIPETLVKELNSIVVSLQNSIDGISVPVYYTDFSASYKGDLNTGFTGADKHANYFVFSIPYLYRANAQTYLKNFNNVTITISIDENGAENIRKESEKRLKIMRNSTDYTYYDLQPIIRKYQLKINIPKDLGYDSYFQIWFPNIEGVTYSNIIFSK